MAKTIDRREFLKVAFAAVTAAFFHKALVLPTATDDAPSGGDLEIEDSGGTCVGSTSARLEFDSGYELLCNDHSDYSYNVQRGDLIVASYYPHWDNTIAVGAHSDLLEYNDDVGWQWKNA